MPWVEFNIILQILYVTCLLRHSDDPSVELHQSQQTLAEKLITVSLLLKQSNTSSEASLFVWQW